ITGLARERGIGVLVVDHDMPFVMGLCDRIVVLNFGRVICEGTPAEVRANADVIAAYLGGTTAEPALEHASAARAASRTATFDDAPALITAGDMAVGYYGNPVVEGIELS